MSMQKASAGLLSDNSTYVGTEADTGGQLAIYMAFWLTLDPRRSARRNGLHHTTAFTFAKSFKDPPAMGFRSVLQQGTVFEPD